MLGALVLTINTTTDATANPIRVSFNIGLFGITQLSGVIDISNVLEGAAVTTGSESQFITGLYFDIKYISQSDGLHQTTYGMETIKKSKAFDILNYLLY